MNNQEEKWISLANRSECLFHEVEVSIDSPYISGTVITLTKDCPFADVILGETAFVKKNTRIEVISWILKIRYISTLEVQCMPENVQDNRMTGKDYIVNKSDKMSQEMVSGVETRSMRVAQSSNEVKEAKLIADYLNDYTTNKINNTSNTKVSIENRMNLKQNKSLIQP